MSAIEVKETSWAVAIAVVLGMTLGVLAGAAISALMAVMS